MSCPALGAPVLEPKPVTQWTMPFLNAGWDDKTPTAFYFGRSASQVAKL